MTSRIFFIVTFGLGAAAAVTTVPAAGQVAVSGTDTATVVADPEDVLGRARAAQANYVRRRERFFPVTFASAGGPCDEVVGRLCTWYGEGEWYPEPEPEGARELREGFIAELDSLQALIPGDGWVLGQRVWYHAEGGDWEGALAVAHACGEVARWWCAALEGFALHGLGRFREAERAFDRALAGMDPEVARAWRVPERAVGSDVRDRLRALERERPDSIPAALGRLWLLADPLFLVEGNDRLTEHYARWTVATLKDGARNPFRLRWGDDLEELTVRHGWEIGWERAPSRTLGGPFQITGHKHPEAREYLPSGEALREPQATSAEDFLADRRRPRSLYAPAYAPVILPLEGQLAILPRGDRMVVVATAFLPEDTSFHAEHEHERSWMEPGSQEGMPDRIGLFAIPVGGGRMLEDRHTGTAQGALQLDLPAGAYVLSVESWSPEARRAGRLRLGLDRSAVPEDVAVLSDILLLEGGRPTPGSLSEALPAALPRAEIRPGQRLAIAWEVAGLGFRSEVLEFAVSVDRTDRGVLRRIGEFLGLSERPPSLALSWQEQGPDRPTHHFRHVDLDLPELEPGDYEITLLLRTRGRSDAVTRRALTVVEH